MLGVADADRDLRVPERRRRSPTAASSPTPARRSVAAEQQARAPRLVGEERADGLRELGDEDAPPRLRLRRGNRSEDARHAPESTRRLTRERTAGGARRPGGRACPRAPAAPHRPAGRPRWPGWVGMGLGPAVSGRWAASGPATAPADRSAVRGSGPGGAPAARGPSPAARRRRDLRRPAPEQPREEAAPRRLDRDGARARVPAPAPARAPPRRQARRAPAAGPTRPRPRARPSAADSTHDGSAGTAVSVTRVPQPAESRDTVPLARSPSQATVLSGSRLVMRTAPNGARW